MASEVRYEHTVPFRMHISKILTAWHADRLQRGSIQAHDEKTPAKPLVFDNWRTQHRISSAIVKPSILDNIQPVADTVESKRPAKSSMRAVEVLGGPRPLDRPEWLQVAIGTTQFVWHREEVNAVAVGHHELVSVEADARRVVERATHYEEEREALRFQHEHSAALVRPLIVIGDEEMALGVSLTQGEADGTGEQSVRRTR
mmetsp:Transcript_20688/g.51696  ORF Transcript_20688/g.51696 Transcript_20688/m.51696 type:complete len:201 (-) Transcript_20688:1007-1609(-)